MHRLALLALAIAAGGGTTSAQTNYHGTDPATSQALSRGLASADSLISAAVEHTIPGAVLVVAQNGRLVHERAFGWAELEDFQGRRLTNPRPMHTTSLFDLASVTKVMATTMAVMRLASGGRIDVDAPVYRYLPDFRGVHLDSITVRHLLTHSAGLVQWQPLYYHASNEHETYDVIRQMPLQWGVGEGRHYSDLGFMLLGYIVERITHQPLDRFVADSIYAPLGLRSTTFLPKRHGFTDFAATEQGNGYERHMVYDSTFGYRYRGDPTAWNGWRQYVLVGETDDGNSWYANNGVAGHAGLFSTAADLRVLLDLLLAHGRAGGGQLISASVIDKFFTRDRYANFLGWMSPNGLPEGSFSHTGFTGTYVLGVPKYGLSIVLLTNRQNMGTDARGYFPDVAPLQLAVAQAIVAGAEADARSSDASQERLGTIGVFDGQTDVGRARPGAATYDPRAQTYTISGSGQNMWADHDDFHFVWKRLAGNFILSTRARFLGPRGDPHRKIGWTIRSSLDAQSPHVTAALHGNGLTSLQFRRTAGAMTEEEKSRDSLPNADAVVQLERRDGAYILSVAQFGDTLVSQTLTGVVLPDTVYVGLYVCSHNDVVVERATFGNVRITIPAAPTLVPYRDYLGSNLEILDVASGNATIVHRYKGSFQAPNWTPDGKALIYVQEGKLYSFDLASGVETPINTGFATRNNNDHVLSFDGRMLGISNHAPEDSGASIVYTVPVTGGTPRRVTARGPSYLHGWSPDGRWLVFTGQRNGDFDVYRIPSAGGDEVRLTSTPGLDDGPEYSPDGRYIYFNSARTGRMQLWRMRPDGSGQEQLTSDGFNNWFPHLSPDGRWIAFISFPPPPEVAADDHPFYKHVLLRLMPTGGGPARVIAYLYGGQGTINVPSWSPDGKRLAFVSNTQMQP
ncbi:MAG TPA: serine hydrolase [Gemmatimonadaceae bacterium]|nr:serine hydrolase [Gemmatimonadaceae bacterium]